MFTIKLRCEFCDNLFDFLPIHQGYKVSNGCSKGKVWRKRCSKGSCLEILHLEGRKGFNSLTICSCSLSLPRKISFKFGIFNSRLGGEI